MKTIKFFQIALVAAMFSFATVANAQTYVDDTPGTVTSTNQVDFVTVGATMPYSAAATDASFADWKTAFEAAFSGKTVNKTIAWKLGSNPISGTADKENIRMKWETAAQYTLEATTTVTIDGVDAGALCPSTPATKTVYVLPEPTVKITSESQVLSCSTTNFTVKYKVAGIGVKAITYTITRRAYDGTGDPTNDVHNDGIVQTTAGFFEEATTTFEEASAEYNVDTQTPLDWAVTGLEPGYIYTLTFTNVTDQISRKSGVTTKTLSANNTITLAVVPEPASTTIQHVKNVE